MGRTNRDPEYLALLRDFFAQHGVLPSHAEAAAAFGLKSKNASLMICRRLAAVGYLERSEIGRLAPGQRFFERAWLDQGVPAGQGDPGEFEASIESHEIDRLLVGTPSKTFLVPVRGDSMKDAGVLDGDVAVVERTSVASAGELVIALVDGSYTIKELGYQGQGPVLIPHNPAFETIRPKAALVIVGVVRGVVRRYGRVAAKSVARRGART